MNTNQYISMSNASILSEIIGSYDTLDFDSRSPFQPKISIDNSSSKIKTSAIVELTKFTEIGLTRNFTATLENGTRLSDGINWNWGKVIIFIIQLIIMIETIIGNLMVVLSVIIEKKLQTPFNYYIVNLAFTDMNVGLSVMSLFTITNLYEYFPFNNFLCGYWIWSDYTMTFESVMTLAAISVDRFWSVTWTLHYRNYNSGRKSALIILATWLLVSLLWLPPFIYDRVTNEYAPGNCYFDTEQNKLVVIYVGLLGYYTPLFVMLGAYARILWVVRKRVTQVKATQQKMEVTIINLEESEAESDATVVAGTRRDSTNQKTKTDDKKKKRESVQYQKLKREQKAVYTLLNIVVIFLICWIPFYVLFVISAWYPSLFPAWFVNFSYWMAYINSALNPILYPFSSPEFRNSYKKIFRFIICKCCT